MSRAWKLSPQDRDAIRVARANGTSAADLAVRFDVSPASIYNVLNGGSPKRVQPPPSRVPAVVRDSRPYRDSTHGYVPRNCDNDRCGQRPARDVATLPLVVYGADIATVEVCSWHCLSRHAIHRELAGGDAA